MGIRQHKPRRDKRRDATLPPELVDFKRRALAAGMRRRKAAAHVRALHAQLKHASRQLGRPVSAPELFGDLDLRSTTENGQWDLRSPQSRAISLAAARQCDAAARAFLSLMPDVIGAGCCEAAPHVDPPSRLWWYRPDDDGLGKGIDDGD